MRRTAALVASFALFATMDPVAPTAQERIVRIVGVVQWIAAEKMMVIPNDGGLPIEVDISQVGQNQYEALTEGSRVVVVGTVSPDGRKLIATAIGSGDGG